MNELNPYTTSSYLRLAGSDAGTLAVYLLYSPACLSGHTYKLYLWNFVSHLKCRTQAIYYCICVCDFEKFPKHTTRVCKRIA